jgi:hypothetical protein
MCSTEHLVPRICTGEVSVNLDLATVYPDAVLLDRGSKRCRNPCTDLERPRGFQELEDPSFQDSRQMKVVSLSTLTAAAFTPRKYSCTHFCWRVSLLHGHSAAGRLLSMKNSGDIIGNRTCDLPPSGRTMAAGSTQPLRDMSTRNISWEVKAADA